MHCTPLAQVLHRRHPFCSDLGLPHLTSLEEADKRIHDLSETERDRDLRIQHIKNLDNELSHLQAALAQERERVAALEERNVELSQEHADREELLKREEDLKDTIFRLNKKVKDKAGEITQATAKMQDKDDTIRQLTGEAGSTPE